MLIELFGRNFGCFRDPFSLSLLATDIEPGSAEGVVQVQVEGDDKPLRLLRCAGIYGPNASGKSTVIRAASALGYLLDASGGFSSDDPLAPHEPFALDEHSRDEPVQLGLRAVVEGRVYWYSVEFDDAGFKHETLVENSVDADTVLFDRRGKRVEGVWTANPRFALLREAFRDNALLLSLADMFAPDLGSAIATGFQHYLQAIDATRWDATGWQAPSRRIAGRLAQHPQFAAWMLNLVRDADTGIEAMTISEDDDGRGQLRLWDEQQTTSPRGARHGRIVTFRHRGASGAHPIAYGRESRGTQKTIELAWYLYQLTLGGEPRAFFIDEIAASLHPHLLAALIHGFNRDTPMSEVRGQLIFATHETSLMEGDSGRAPLRRDQVYFTEKASDGSARLYSLSEFKERHNLNLRKRYLHGRYGAIPALGHFDQLWESN